MVKENFSVRMRELIRQRVSTYELRTGQSGLSDLSYLLNLVYTIIINLLWALSTRSEEDGGKPF